MNNQNQNSNGTDVQVDPKVLFWNRLQLILVLFVFAAPIAGAFLYKPKAFSNYGDIYTPVRPVDNLLMTGKGGEVELDSMRRQWILLVTANGTCDSVCEENILKVRQLRFMQNNNMVRIRTVFLHINLPVAISDDLAAKYSPIESYSAQADDYEKWIPVLELENAPVEAQRNRVYIIDPAGNLMMSYPAAAEPKQIQKDLKRLLKTSQIG